MTSNGWTNVHRHTKQHNVENHDVFDADLALFFLTILVMRPTTICLQNIS